MERKWKTNLKSLIKKTKEIKTIIIQKEPKGKGGKHTDRGPGRSVGRAGRRGRRGVWGLRGALYAVGRHVGVCRLHRDHQQRGRLHGGRSDDGADQQRRRVRQRRDAAGGACASCDAFGAGCASCSGAGCDACPAGTVVENGRCVASAHCADADGTRCVRCANGDILQTDTVCVADGSAGVHVVICAVCARASLMSCAKSALRVRSSAQWAQFAMRTAQRAQSSAREAQEAGPRARGWRSCPRDELCGRPPVLHGEWGSPRRLRDLLCR